MLELQVNCRKGQVAFRTRESARRKKNTSHTKMHILEQGQYSNSQPRYKPQEQGMLSCILSKRGDFLSGRGCPRIDQLLCHVPVVERKMKMRAASRLKSVLWPESSVANKYPAAILAFVSRSLLFGLLQHWPCSNIVPAPTLSLLQILASSNVDLCQSCVAPIWV
jgi:hypothetical protein